MFSSLSLTFLFIAVFTGTITYAAPVSNDVCKANFFDQGTCEIGVGTSSSCQTSTLNLAESKLASCNSGSIFWNYPVNTLIVTIVTPYTQKRQPFFIRLDNEQMKLAISRVCQVSPQGSAELQPIGNIITAKSDSNYQVVLKFEAPSTLRFYGVFIKYTVVPKKHKLKEVCTQSLTEAVADNLDPRTIKLFNENESIIDYLWEVPCPFINGPLDLSEYRQKYTKNILCSHKLVRLDHLKNHLRCHHHMENRFAQKLVDVFKELRSKYNTTTSLLIPST
ncbi:unnamed protein product [Rotaria sp. Silwood1]|nr:unnamed protein product [Rotaria sp. Silwood1]